MQNHFHHQLRFLQNFHQQLNQVWAIHPLLFQENHLLILLEQRQHLHPLFEEPLLLLEVGANSLTDLDLPQSGLIHITAGLPGAPLLCRRHASEFYL